MDCEDLTKTLRLAKKQLEENNKLFLKSLDKKIAGEIKFRASICRIAKSTDSVLDMLRLRGELEDDDKSSGETKRDLKLLIDLCLKLKREANLSRIRSKGLEKFAEETKVYFGIKPVKPITIPDSPTRPTRKSTRNAQIVPYSTEPSISTLALTTIKSNETMITGIRILDQRPKSILKNGQTSYSHHQNSYDRRN